MRRLTTITCRFCGKEATRDYRSIYCLSCLPVYKRKPLASIAMSKVYLAKKSGELQSPKDFDCLDCGKAAEVYDHRDYRKPLEVDPVCYSCNSLRGPALPYCGLVR